MSLTQWKGLVAAPISGLLRQSGFRKSGLKFSSIRAEAILLVSLQSSVGTTREVLRITCNLAIVLHALGRRDNHDIWDSHWKERIGYFMPEPGIIGGFVQLMTPRGQPVERWRRYWRAKRCLRWSGWPHGLR